EVTLLSLARTYQLTAYDAAYLELALRTASPLATFDEELVKAAPAAGVALFLQPGAAS
ncbi:MAG: type II toxin-antitoxin system VapC family toxin, partial [Candidatus Tectomicrobia bacterium]|nr:type II toxin-antitoxin system VapC family toxin [Candidatus Tectomicrobia bacterium]